LVWHSKRNAHPKETDHAPTGQSLFLQPYRVLCHQGNYFVLEVVEPYVGFGAAIFILRGDDNKIHGGSVGVVVNPRSGVYIDGFLLQMVKG
jgi:hypothetical protein